MTIETEGTGMDFDNGTGWVAIGVGIVASVIGWRVKSAVDSERMASLSRDMEALKDRVRGLEHGSISTATALATLATQIEGIGKTLTRMENKLDGKADK